MMFLVVSVLWIQVAICRVAIWASYSDYARTDVCDHCIVYMLGMHVKMSMFYDSLFNDVLIMCMVLVVPDLWIHVAICRIHVCIHTLFISRTHVSCLSSDYDIFCIRWYVVACLMIMNLWKWYGMCC